jgi:TolB-like protein/DNA-binding winged helix-turn-helix (wHTH) protein/tetratricopeptide (TPR) repeat protein
MAAPAPSPGTIRFGVFEADLRSGELRKDGVKVKLEGQPFQVLAVLLTRSGELVTREELRKELWPDETFVDFEQGINAAVKRLRLALEDSADTPTFIETLPRRGYRFIAPVENGVRPSLPDIDQNQAEPTSLGVVAVSAETQTGQSRLRVTARWRRILIGIAGIAALALLVLGLNPFGVRDRMLGRPRTGEITSIVVLPLTNLTGDPGQDYFVDGMTDGLITELGKISALRVISFTTALTYKNAKKPLPEIARELGVDAVLEGAVARNGDRVRITTRVIHLSQERTLLSEKFERDLREISTLQSEIVLVVADEIKVKLLSQEKAHLARTRQVNPRAYEAYLKGRDLQARRNHDDMVKALAYFQHALEIDPSYAPAYVGIVDCYSIGGGRQMGVSIKEADARMKEAAHKVMELDDTTAAAHYAVAILKWHAWDFPGAEKEFQRALELDPGDVQARQHYGHYLLSMRRWTDARRELHHALALDPLSPMLTADLGFPGLFSGHPEETVKQCQQALEMQKDYPYAQQILASAYWQLGRRQEALELGWPSPLQRERSRRAKEVYDRAGVNAMLRWLLKDTEQRNPTGEFYSRSAEVAHWYLELGEKEKALTWFEKAYQEHDPWLPMDLAGPLMNPLRSDPRFQDLLRRIGLTP